MRFNDKWPETLSILRHGQSAGNVARDEAEARNSETIDIEDRDIDVPLSELGVRQARGVGEWFLAQPVSERPDVILTSPYVRAQQTAREVQRALGGTVGGVVGGAVEFVSDERLREREFGLLEGLTWHGVEVRHPTEAKMRAHLGKFYYRPPGGESWADVILRLRSVLDSLSRDYANRRVLLVCHSAVILCLRYIFEGLTEKQILDIERHTDIANCSLTTYHFESREGTVGHPRLVRFNFVAPLTHSARAGCDLSSNQ